MKVQTVLGPIELDSLGRTLMHEHLFISFPGAEFDPTAMFDRTALVTEAVRRLRQLREQYQVRTFVDPCPIELGRDVAMMAEISEKSEMNIVCTTGFYFEALGLPVYWRARSTEEIAELYIREIEHGICNTAVRPGAIKVATGAPVISQLERKFLDAACLAHRATGVPLITHTQSGVCGPDQIAAFKEGGVPAHRCLIGHCCESSDRNYHRRVVDAGAYIGFDRIGAVQLQSDAVRADCLVALVRDGYGGQIMMSQDRYCGIRGKLPRAIGPEEQARIDALRQAGNWPPPYTHLFTDFFPLLQERGLDVAQMHSILEENPRRFFAAELPPAIGAPWPPTTVS